MQICLELSYSMFFLYAIEYLLTALNQEQEGLMAGAVWLAVVGVFLVAMWVGFFVFYPLPVSFV